MSYRFLTYGRLSPEFADFIGSTYPELDLVRAESKAAIKKLLPEVNAIAGFSLITDEDISHVEWIHTFGAGVDGYLKHTLNESVVLTRTSGNLGLQMGEYCLAYLLADAQAIHALYEQQKKNVWHQIPTSKLHTWNVLILGTGTIGKGIADCIKGSVNKLIGLNTSGNEVTPFDAITDWNMDSMPEIHAVINALTLTSMTHSKLNGSFFDHLSDCLFINVGRGETVDESALLNAIETGNVRKAILDVFTEEPLPVDSVFWKHEKILVSPHQSGITTIQDLTDSFDLVYDAIRKGTRNHLFFNRKKGY